jgi:hypothetical protein
MLLETSSLSGERRARTWVAGLLFVSTVAISTRARAEPSADSPTAGEVSARYDTIVANLDEGEGSARLWWWGWTSAFGALVVGEGVVALAARDPGTRTDAVVGLAGSVLGVGAMLFTSRAAFTYRKRLASLDASTPALRLARLREAERIQDAAADDEESGRSWFAHVGGDVVTLAGSFVLWAGYHRYSSGWLNLVGGTIVTEAQILTRPTAAIKARRAYRGWTFHPTFGGASLTRTF